ncbi:MAG: hypothetical protein KDK66_05475 [Deltaproteobacteria bacterium]|nr:hypothetical protein [Deltaproteobacteria bacterium]
MGMSSSMTDSFNFYTLTVGIFFSLIGWACWRYGRKTQSGRHMILGAGLMAYPYFVASPWWSLATGSTLTALIFWP